MDGTRSTVHSCKAVCVLRDCITFTVVCGGVGTTFILYVVTSASIVICSILVTGFYVQY